MERSALGIDFERTRSRSLASMNIKERLRQRGIRQFHEPSGCGGRVAGWVMGHRSSNVRRSRWAVELLDVQPDEHVLELGCGPGVAIAALAQRATDGLV